MRLAEVHQAEVGTAPLPKAAAGDLFKKRGKISQ